MKALLVLLMLVVPTSASAFSFLTGGCATAGCDIGDVWLNTNANELANAIGALETTTASHTSTLAGLSTVYLPLTGGTLAGTLDMPNSSATIAMGSGATIVVGPGAIIGPVSSGTIRATAMSASGQIDGNDLAAGAVNGGLGGEIADESIDANDIATGGVTTSEILDNTVALITDTVGDFIATITGDSEITVTGAGTEGRAVTLAIATGITRDTELNAKSAADGTTTANHIAKFSDVNGDIQDSGVTIDSSNNISSPGNASLGGSTGASTFTMRNTVDSGWVECGVVGTTMTCATDTDGQPDGTL